LKLNLEPFGAAFMAYPKSWAVSQLLYTVAVKWRGITGGSGAIGGVVPPQIADIGFSAPTVVYYLVPASYILSSAALSRIVRSKAGRVFIGIRENETRPRG
jgi:branched-chain amino acid transport system permease protein